MWDGKTKLEGQDASWDTQPAVSYNDEGNSVTKGKYFKEIKKLSSRKLKRPTAQLMCLYTSTHNLRNKLEKLEATVLLENYDVVAVTETW